MPNDTVYFTARARKERRMASVAEDNAVALAHLMMADAYDRRLAEMPARVVAPPR
jgi:hypothetical protein